MSTGARGQRGITGLTTASILVFLVSLAATLIYYLWTQFPDIGEERSVASNLGFFLLINLNIIAVMILVFLVTKNLITLVLDRRKNILGSRLRSRLVTAFVGLSLIPTVLLFLVAKGILESVLQGWFSPQIAASVDGALGVAKFHSDSAQAVLERQTRLLSEELARVTPLLGGTAPGTQKWSESEAIRALLKHKREEYGLAAVALVEESGDIVVESEAESGRQSLDAAPPPNVRAVQRALQAGPLVRPEHSLGAEFLRGYAALARPAPTYGTGSPAQYGSSGAPPLVLVTTEYVSPELGAMLSSVVNAYEDYNELRTYRRPLASTYLLTLVVVTLLIVFAAIWVGFYLAKSLSIPIGSLAKGTDQVAHGNLDYQIPEVGDDELSVLVRSFNTMTADLKATTAELVARRRYMETVFANVAVGVLSVDRELRIRAINFAAEEMLDLRKRESLQAHVTEILPEELSKQVREMTEALFSGAERTLEANVSVHVKEQPKHLLVTITRLHDDTSRAIGAVVLLDDLTELVSAQRMAAWREVARRIAHEIKNPLTPIQLCAQRMQRRFAGVGSGDQESPDRKIILECTDIIVQQVENLRTLVNEFSGFARMPKSTPKLGDLNTLLEETARIYRQAHPELLFTLELDSLLPQFEFDREQLGRALINLLDNAVASILGAHEGVARDDLARPLGAVSLSSRYDSGLDLAIITVQDTGTGISDRDKPRLFEPYFSTKRGGTGLGLAIVSAIVADHHGFVRVRDNKPQGASFILELPITSLPKVANEIAR